MKIAENDIGCRNLTAEKKWANAKKLRLQKVVCTGRGNASKKSTKNAIKYGKCTKNAQKNALL